MGKGCFGPITIGPLGVGRGLIGTIRTGGFGPITIGPLGVGRGLIGTIRTGGSGPITVGPLGVGRGLIGTIRTGGFEPITVEPLGVGRGLIGTIRTGGFEPITVEPLGVGRGLIGTNGNGRFGFFIFGIFVIGVLVRPGDVTFFDPEPFRGFRGIAFVNPPCFLPVGRGLVCCVRGRLPLDCVALVGRERPYLAFAAEERVEVERADFEFPREEFLETDDAREKPLLPPRCGLASVTDTPTAITAAVKRINVGLLTCLIVLLLVLGNIFYAKTICLP